MKEFNLEMFESDSNNIRVLPEVKLVICAADFLKNELLKKKKQQC